MKLQITNLASSLAVLVQICKGTRVGQVCFLFFHEGTEYNNNSHFKSDFSVLTCEEYIEFHSFLKPNRNPS